MNPAGVSSFFEQPVPERQSFLTDPGRLAVFLFAIEAVTGALLALYYRPAPEAAFASVQLVANAVSMGWLIRSVHLVAGNAVVGLAALLVVRAFFGRRFLGTLGRRAWLLTTAFFLLMLAFLFTGAALPWDQVAYWRTVVSANLVAETPLVGSWLADVLRGGGDVTGLTLVRLYAAHALLLPWVAVWTILRMRRLLKRWATA